MILFVAPNLGVLFLTLEQLIPLENWFGPPVVAQVTLQSVPIGATIPLSVTATATELISTIKASVADLKGPDGSSIDLDSPGVTIQIIGEPLVPEVTVLAEPKSSVVLLETPKLSTIELEGSKLSSIEGEFPDIEESVEVEVKRPQGTGE